MNNESIFVGYDVLTVDTTVLSLMKGNENVDTLTAEGYVILKETPFYAESGGQIADTGYIIGDNIKLEVIDVKKGPNKEHIHQVKVLEGTIHVNDNVKAEVNSERRDSITKNHSVSHVIHKVLNEVLNTTITQAGAKIYDTFLRFDFTYAGQIDDDIIIKVEKGVNEKIKHDVPTITEIMSLEDAKKKGVTLVFEDRYGETVRVVTIYDSVELCAGTHVKNVKDIDKFAVISLEPRGSNVYRITATTLSNIIPEFKEAIKTFEIEKEKLMAKANNIINDAKENDIPLSYNLDAFDKELTCYEDMIQYKESLHNLQKHVKELEEEYIILKQKKALENTSLFETLIEDINGIKVIINKISNYDSKLLVSITDYLIKNNNLKLIFIANINNGIVSYVARIHESLIGKVHCGDIIKEASIKSGGSGGGTASFAQGGGRNIDNIDDIVNSIKELVLNIK